MWSGKLGSITLFTDFFFAVFAHLKADLYLVFNSLFQNKGLFLQHFQVSCNKAQKEEMIYFFKVANKTKQKQKCINSNSQSGSLLTITPPTTTTGRLLLTGN